MKEFWILISVQVDDDEIDTPEKLAAKRAEIKEAIEDMAPSIGVFQIESFGTAQNKR